MSNHKSSVHDTSATSGRHFRARLGQLLKMATGKASVWLAFVSVCTWLNSGGAQAASFWVHPYLQNVTENSIVICWETEAPADGTVEYWAEGSQSSSIITVDVAQRQEVRLTDLQPGTGYGYRVRMPAIGEGTFFTGGFRTAPTEDAAFTLVVYGDSRESDVDDEDHKQVADAVRAINPAFVIHTGDIVALGYSGFFWDLFWRTVAPADGERSLAGNTVLYPALGNHDYMGAAGKYSDEAVLKHRSYFVLPPNGLEGEHPGWSERFYSFRYGPAFFIVLDLNNDSDPDYKLYNAFEDPRPPDIHPGSPQYEWLVNQLKTAQALYPFTFVSFHPSPYSSGPWGKSSSFRMRFLDPLFRQYGVDAVFSSHDHFYERCQTYVDDYRILYFVSGAGGAGSLDSLYEQWTGWDAIGSWMWDEVNQTFHTKAFDRSSFSFLKVEIAPLENGAWQATFSGTRPNGEVFDMVRITRPWRHISFSETVRLSFDSSPGKTYEIEYSDGLPGAEMLWQPLGAPILADSPFIRIVDDGTHTGVSPADPSLRHRFYRIREAP